MTDKREDREALIEGVKVAIQKRATWRSLHWPNLDALAHEDVARALAEAALAVFEQALGEATSTPTDDEREAYLPADVYNRLMAHLMAGGRGGLLLAGEVQSLTGASALRRRSVQGEPSRPLTPCGNIACTGCRECGCPALGIEPQGEPTDAQVLAALNEYEAWSAEESLDMWGTDQAERMRRALCVAAATQGGESRG